MNDLPDEPRQDFWLEPEHVELQHHFRRFVTDKLSDIAAKAEKEKRFAREAFGILRDAGYLAINYPEEVGGGGGDLLSACIYYEELTRASAGLSSGLFAHQHLGCGPIFKFGTTEQKEEFLLPGLRGEKIGAFGLTEPDAGSDIRGIKTWAKADGDDYVLKGSKLYITNGAIADFVLVAARTGTERSSDSITMFVVRSSTKGFEARELDKLGNYSVSTAFITLDDVRVHKSSILGEFGRGLAQLKATLTDGRILVANRGLGLAQLAVDLTVQYAQERKAFGQPIGKFQGVAFRIAELATQVDAARMMIYRAARLRMAGKDCAREASMAKLSSSKAAMDACTSGLLLHGGAGYMNEMKIAELYRDAPEAWIGEGTNEIQKLVIARTMGLA